MLYFIDTILDYTHINEIIAPKLFDIHYIKLDNFIGILRNTINVRKRISDRINVYTMFVSWENHVSFVATVSSAKNQMISRPAFHVQLICPVIYIIYYVWLTINQIKQFLRLHLYFNFDWRFRTLIIVIPIKINL